MRSTPHRSRRILDPNISDMLIQESKAFLSIEEHYDDGNAVPNLSLIIVHNPSFMIPHGAQTRLYPPRRLRHRHRRDVPAQEHDALGVPLRTCRLLDLHRRGARRRALPGSWAAYGGLLLQG